MSYGYSQIDILKYINRGLFFTGAALQFFSIYKYQYYEFFGYPSSIYDRYANIQHNIGCPLFDLL